MGQKTQTGREAFDLGKYFGEVSMARRPADLERSVDILVEPAATSETLHWGRNYLYSAEIETAGATVEVVVKQFRNQGLKARLERREKGSKAQRSWRGAWALHEAGIPTPEPVFLIESKATEGPSFFVSQRLQDVLEARYYFRALEAGHEQEEFPELDPERVMDELGRSIRHLHDAGIWHRDLSIGNVLFRGTGKTNNPLTVYFIDLNRARQKRRLTTLHRTRDLCRLRIFRPAHQECFLIAYWGAEPRNLWRKRLLYRLCFRSFLFKVWAKKIIRHPFGGLRNLILPRHPHAHIPQAPEGASSRDRAVWDGLSDQPHQHATRAQRLAVRLVDTPLHVRELAAGARAIFRIRRRFLELRSQLYSRPVFWEGMGVAIRPWPENPEALLMALEKLGTKRVLLRLHPWQQKHTAEEELAGELHRRGYEMAFVLPQNRELVCDLDRWRAAVTELVDRFGKLGRHFQVGQAINRSKWGIWNYREYMDLVAVAAEILRQDPRRELLGPAIIDYEPLRTAGILNLHQPGVRFDILASLLYVDRRGAPENKQLGFDTVDKVLQLKAIADTSPNCGDRSWITETNWPLREGPHSPAGRKVAVDEEAQADYLVRYYLLTLGTATVERVYWWQLVARGYGLAFDGGEGELHCRPSFAAFATLSRHLEGTMLLGPIDVPAPGRLHHFRGSDGTDLMVGWTTDDSRLEVSLPHAVERAVGRGGHELTVSGRQVEIGSSPRYFWLKSE